MDNAESRTETDRRYCLFYGILLLRYVNAAVLIKFRPRLAISDITVSVFFSVKLIIPIGKFSFFLIKRFL